MNSFLEKLYSMENFGIYLFVVIGILVVLFLVILFFGKKDQKNKEKITPVEDENKTQDTFKEESVPTPVEVSTPVAPVIPEDVPAPLTTNVVLNDNLSVAPTPVMPAENDNEVPVQAKEFDFDALANAISKELESIDKPSEKEEMPSPKIPTAEPENIVSPDIHEEETHIHPAMPTVFSSVYVNREKEEPKAVTEIKDEVPIKPSIELPKMVEMPKMANQEEVMPVIEEKTTTQVFPNV